MKFSDATIEILKNFAAINQCLIVRPGRPLKTSNHEGSIRAVANTQEKFTQEFGIYDLNTTLSLLSINKNSPLEIEVVADKYLRFISLSGTAEIHQRLSPIERLNGYDHIKKDVGVSYDVEIPMSEEIQNWIFAAASILKVPDLVIKTTEDNQVRIFVMDVKPPKKDKDGDTEDNITITNDASVLVDAKWNGAPFTIVLKIENLKIIPGAYDLSLSKTGWTHWKHRNKNIEYFIASQANHTVFK